LLTVEISEPVVCLQGDLCVAPNSGHTNERVFSPQSPMPWSCTHILVVSAVWTPSLEQLEQCSSPVLWTPLTITMQRRYL